MRPTTTLFAILFVQACSFAPLEPGVPTDHPANAGADEAAYSPLPTPPRRDEVPDAVTSPMPGRNAGGRMHRHGGGR